MIVLSTSTLAEPWTWTSRLKGRREAEYSLQTGIHVKLQTAANLFAEANMPRIQQRASYECPSSERLKFPKGFVY